MERQLWGKGITCVGHRAFCIISDVGEDPFLCCSCYQCIIGREALWCLVGPLLVAWLLTLFSNCFVRACVCTHTHTHHPKKPFNYFIFIIHLETIKRTTVQTLNIESVQYLCLFVCVCLSQPDYLNSLFPDLCVWRFKDDRLISLWYKQVPVFLEATMLLFPKLVQTRRFA